MLLVGDIAVPQKKHCEILKMFFDECYNIFNDKLLICNFEGIIANESYLNANVPILFNNIEVLDVLKSRGEVIACLANNHISDLPEYFIDTCAAFKENGIKYCGAGLSLNKANEPVTFIDNDKEVIIFNACWNFLLYNHKNPKMGVYVAEIDELKLLQSVMESREKKPDSIIVIYLHWNFDLETLPFPMHRKFAKELIDAGANIVVGSHSHCVQGGEKYKNGYIVYGLGNFFIPNNIFANGKVTYPSFAKTELVIEWDHSKDNLYCHWVEYNNTDGIHKLQHISSDIFENSPKLREFSPFQCMTDEEYITYFKLNRRKKKFIPIYQDFYSLNKNKLFTYYLKLRARFARFLAKHNIIKWQN